MMHMNLVIIMIVLVHNSRFMVDGAAVISREVVCERARKGLSCPEGQVISIVKGFYGRTETKICARGAHHKTDCLSCGSGDVIKKTCNGKQSCSLRASSTIFGDPCKGISKYISVEYTCQ